MAIFSLFFLFLFIEKKKKNVTDTTEGRGGVTHGINERSVTSSHSPPPFLLFDMTVDTIFAVRGVRFYCLDVGQSLTRVSLFEHLYSFLFYWAVEKCY